MDFQETKEKKGYFKAPRLFNNFIDKDFQFDLISAEWDSSITNVDVMANNITESILKTKYASVVNTWVKPNAQPKKMVVQRIK